MSEPTCPRCDTKVAQRQTTEGPYVLDERKCPECGWYQEARNNAEVKPARPADPL